MFSLNFPALDPMYVPARLVKTKNRKTNKRAYTPGSPGDKRRRAKRNTRNKMARLSRRINRS